MLRLARPLFASFAAALMTASSTEAAIITVDNNLDTGVGSLRAAITLANADDAFDQIKFNLDAGERIITPATPLPVITKPADIDGTSQSGWTNAPLIGLNGATAAGTGLRCTATFCSVRGLAIYKFTNGVSMEGTFATVRSNYIGLTTAGAGGFGNTQTGLSIQSDFSSVGGTTLVDRNVISGNGGNGIVIGAAANGGIFQNNYIGTNVAGTAAIGNGGYGIRCFGVDNQIGTNLINGGNLISGNDRGISLESADDTGTTLRNNIIGLSAAGTAKVGNTGAGIELSSSNNTVGGTFALDLNLISGNQTGISIGEGETGNTIQSNYIGVDTTGTVAIGNGTGINVNGSDSLIGGTVALAPNVISGNFFNLELAGSENHVEGNMIGTNALGTAKLGDADSGVRMYGTLNVLGGAAAGAGNVISGNKAGVLVVSSQGNSILGNRIGTNKAGNAGIGNGGYGIRVIDSSDTTIGGPAAGAGNVISGNGRGIAFDGDAPNNILQGNIIGLAADGTAPLGATSGSGLEIGSSGNLIGGPDAGAGNVISSNQYYGIVLQGPDATDNLIQGNKIGVASDGTTARGNYFNVLFYGASGNTIGGTGAGEGNIISASVNAAVYVWFGTHNSILGNSIFANGGAGIDLDPQGPAVNDDLDADTGSNERQNVPVITSAVVNAAQLVIQGQLVTGPSAFYRIEFYSNASCDTYGTGEGKTYLGSTQVMTDANGIATIATSVPFSSLDTVLTATATSPDGDTSEFSPCAAINEGPNPGTLVFTQDTYLAYEEIGYVTISVIRTGGATGAVTVHYATSDDTATSPADYASTSGTLSFADGEFLKTFKVPLVLDGSDGTNEHIGLALSDPTGGATLGDQDESDILLFDYELSFPGVYISDATVLEGDSGTVNANFKVTMTPTDHTVKVHVCTTAGTATGGGVDFDDLETELTFNAGDPPKTVSIPVHGDNEVEGIEVFYLLACGQLDPGGYAGDFGHGYIIDDESELPPPVCGNGLAQDPETCDDGDNEYAAGDQCSPDCEIYYCGVPTKKLTLQPKSSDALFVLKAAVQTSNCAFEVCDASGNKIVQASDALLILKKAVGQNVTLNCPVENG